MSNRPGEVRDAILEFLRGKQSAVHVSVIESAVSEKLGRPVPSSSVRSYLNINTPGTFVRTSRGTYKLARAK